jgi:hypothetical protein
MCVCMVILSSISTLQIERVYGVLLHLMHYVDDGIYTLAHVVIVYSIKIFFLKKIDRL